MTSYEMRISDWSSDVCSADLTTARVSGKGTIVMAPLGEVAVGGLTPSQTGERIAHALKTLGVFLQPSVNVLVTEYRSKTVAVLGAVSKPGENALDRSEERRDGKVWGSTCRKRW